MSNTDYATFSSVELLQAYKRINKEKYPENFSSLIAEAQKRGLDLTLSDKPEVATAFPWRRYWAKNVDFLLLTLVFVITAGQFIEDSKLFDILFYFVMVGIVVGYESFMLAKFQTTFGKWLLKVQVVKSDGSKISFDDSLARSWYCQAWGNGLCIPLLSFVANIVAYNKLNSAGTTSWDEKAGTRVEIGTLSMSRKAASALIIIGIYGFFIAVTIFATQAES